ncbi:MAG: hypothetical protein JWP11_1051 [Frankiales bacterium]|nr:hypothetical protein [Frankiales bacterium]
MLLAEDAQYIDGCFNIERGGWSVIQVDEDKPHLTAALVLRFLVPEAELDQPHELHLSCWGADDDLPFINAMTEVEATRPPGDQREDGVPLDLVVRLDGPLPGLGMHRVAIAVDAVEVGVIPFQAIPMVDSD